MFLCTISELEVILKFPRGNKGKMNSQVLEADGP